MALWVRNPPFPAGLIFMLRILSRLMAILWVPKRAIFLSTISSQSRAIGLAEDPAGDGSCSKSADNFS